jgi:hypothetical protein
VPDDIAIEWKTAQVTALASNRLELRVQLSDAPDKLWQMAFDQASGQHSSHRADNFGKPVAQDSTLVVGNILDTADIEEIRQALDDTVADANDRASRARQREIDDAAASEQAKKDAERHAHEMTERLREG